MKDSRVSLPGSDRAPLGDADILGPAAAEASIEVTVVLRRRAELPPDPAPGGLSRAQLAARYGADPADVALVDDVVTRPGATVTQADPASRRLRCRERSPPLSDCSGPRWNARGSPQTRWAAHPRPASCRKLSVPSALADVVTAGSRTGRPAPGRQSIPDRAGRRPRARATPPGSGPGLPDGRPAPTVRVRRWRSSSSARIRSGRPETVFHHRVGHCRAHRDRGRCRRGREHAGTRPPGCGREVLLDIEVAGAIAPGRVSS